MKNSLTLHKSHYYITGVDRTIYISSCKRFLLFHYCSLVRDISVNKSQPIILCLECNLNMNTCILNNRGQFVMSFETEVDYIKQYDYIVMIIYYYILLLFVTIIL